MLGAVFLLADLLNSHQICWQIYCHQICQLKLGGISTSRFTNCHQICQQICWLSPNLPVDMKGSISAQQIHWLSPNLWAEILGVRKFWSADLLTVTKSASRKGGYLWDLLTEMLGAVLSACRFTDIHTKSASRLTDCHKICQQIYWLSPILSPEMRGYFCWQIYWLSPNLPADLLTVTKSAGRFAEFHQICWQKCGGSISAGRFTDSQ